MPCRLISWLNSVNREVLDRICPSGTRAIHPMLPTALIRDWLGMYYLDEWHPRILVSLMISLLLLPEVFRQARPAPKPSISRVPRHLESSHSNEPNIANLHSADQHTSHQSTRQHQDFPATHLTPDTDVCPLRRTPPGHRCPSRLPHHPSPDGLALPLP
jgi:hypothetical protein